jgi:hypothetical protein
LARLGRTLLRDPAEGLDRVRQSIEIRIHRDERAPFDYRVEAEWEKRLHELLGAPWPCAALVEFDDLWSGLESSLEADGLGVGLLHHDANRALARAAWCVTRHTRPERVLETGVARGMTSRFVLEGLERNSRGRLWSIDLPDPDGQAERRVGSAVPESLRGRWIYMRGASKRLLPKVTSRLRTFDLFIHDSLHSERNMLFEMRTVWPALSDRGVLLADDIGMNAAFAGFAGEVDVGTSFVARKDGGHGLFGIIVKAAAPKT